MRTIEVEEGTVLEEVIEDVITLDDICYNDVLTNGRTRRRMNILLLTEKMIYDNVFKNVKGVLNYYTGKVYKPIESKDYINSLCRDILLTRDNRALYSSKAQGEVIHHLKGECFMSNEDIDSSSKYMAFENCLLNIDTMETKDYESNTFVQNLLDYEYNTNAECDEWLNYLHTTFNGDEKDIAYLQEIMGYCFWRGMPRASIFFFLGKPGSGKSTFQKVLIGLIGKENTTRIKLREFKQERSITTLYGKMVNLVGENKKTMTEREYIDDTVLEATSGDMIKGRLLYREPFDFEPYAKHIINLNDLPEFAEPEGAFFDRLFMLKFPNEFRGRKEEISEYHKILLKEKSGIFNWAMKGLKKLRKNKWYFHVSEKNKMLKDRYKQDVDPYYYWFKTCIIKNKDGEIDMREVWDNDWNNFLDSINFNMKNKGSMSKFFRSIDQHEKLKNLNTPTPTLRGYKKIGSRINEMDYIKPNIKQSFKQPLDDNFEEVDKNDDSMLDELDKLKDYSR